MSRRNLVSKDMMIDEIVTTCPESFSVMQSLGFWDSDRPIATWESIEDVARRNGMDSRELVRMLNNECY